MNRTTSLLLLLAACNGDKGSAAADDTADPGPDTADTADSADSAADSGETGEPPVDADGDGHDSSLDCDDADDAVYPGAPEACNGLDDDCDDSTTDLGRVSVDGAGSWTSIGEAVAAAAAGAEVQVCAGTYAETVTISADLRLVSRDGAEATIIDAGGAGPAVSVAAGAVTISGFTLTGGQSEGLGGGLSVTGADPVAVEDCVVTGNSSTDGGGVYAYAGAQLSLARTTIEGNEAGIGGGLFQTSDGETGSLTLTECTIRDNVGAEAGGGLYLDRVPEVNVVSTLIEANGSDVGAGIYLAQARVFLEGSMVYGNAAGFRGGGAYAYILEDAGVLVSTDTDWGEGGEDNSPDDVSIFNLDEYAGLGAGESFSCDAGGCDDIGG